MINTNGLSRDQERDLEKLAERFRFSNRNGEARAALPGEGLGDCEKEGPMTVTTARDYGALIGQSAQTRPVIEPVTLDNVDDVMRYQPWDREQLAAGDVVREALTAAVKAILRHVPACPTRSEVVHDLVNARMKANAAISFRGRF